MTNLQMLWTSLRLNWGNTLAIAAFCMLAMLGAVNNGFVLDERNGAGRGEMLACSRLCEEGKQSEVGVPRAHVAAAPRPLVQPTALAVD